VPLSKTQVVLYTILAVGIVAGLVYGIPRWQLVVIGLAVGLADAFTDRKEPPPDVVAEWPWRRRAFWVVLGCFVVLAACLAYMGVPVRVNVMICSLGLVFYGYHVARQIEAKRAQMRGTIQYSPGVEDWALLAVSVGFCVIGLLLVRYDWRTAVVTNALFGGGALTFLDAIRRKQRAQRWKGATVRVVGGVNIYVDTPRMGFIALGLCVVGAIIYFVGIDYPLLFRLLGAFIAVVGVGLGIAMALGFHGRNFIRFDRDAFTVREGRICYRIAWDNFARVVEIEYARNPFVGIEVASEHAVVVEPAARGDLFLRLVHRNRGFMGVDVLIAAGHFGIDASVLSAALTRYATDADARAELVKLKQLER